MPSALIPFCSFGGNIGETMRDDFNLPVCTMFQPTILDGQQCYQLKDDLYTGQGKDQGLAFLVDINADRSVHFSNGNNLVEDKSDQTHLKALFSENVSKVWNSWSFHINALSSFYGSRPGSHIMNNVKKIRATENFLSLADDTKKCRDDVYEKCISWRLLNIGKQRFGCTPFDLSLAAKKELVSH